MGNEFDYATQHALPGWVVSGQSFALASHAPVMFAGKDDLIIHAVGATAGLAAANLVRRMALAEVGRISTFTVEELRRRTSRDAENWVIFDDRGLR